MKNRIIVFISIFIIIQFIFSIKSIAIESSTNPNYTNEDLEKYIERKKAIFKWYKFSNEFIEKIDKLK